MAAHAPVSSAVWHAAGEDSGVLNCAGRRPRTCTSAPSPKEAVGGVTNVLGGSKKPSSTRPHAFVIDADFVTCTQ